MDGVNQLPLVQQQFSSSFLGHSLSEILVRVATGLPIEYKEIKEEMRTSMPNLSSQTLRDMQAVGWNMASIEAQKQSEKLNAYRASLPPEQRCCF